MATAARPHCHLPSTIMQDGYRPQGGLLAICHLPSCKMATATASLRAVMSHWGPYPAKVRLGLTHPHGGTQAAILQDGGLRIYSSSLTVGYVIPIRRGLLPPLNSKFSGASHTKPHGGTAREGEKPRKTCNARGFCPHFWGGANLHPLFFNFGPGG